MAPSAEEDPVEPEETRVGNPAGSRVRAGATDIELGDGDGAPT